MSFKLSKYFNNISGLDLRSSDLNRKSGAATDMTNALYRRTGALSKRPGFQFRTNTGEGSLGMVKFNNTNITTGVTTEQILTVDDNLHLMSDESMTLTYTGSTSAYINLYLDATTSLFTFQVYENNLLTQTYDLGTGRGSSDTTTTELKDLLHALTDFTCTISGGGSTPAAFMPIQRNLTVTASLPYKGYAEVSTPTGYSNPFATHFAARADDDFENASFAQLNEALYISNGYDDLHKYDGTRVYKAGLPTPATITAVETGAGSMVNGTYKYKITHEYTDGKENYIEGAASNEVTVVVASTFDVSVGYTIIANTTGYDTDSTDLKTNIYRTKAGGSIFYLLESVTNATASPYVDTIDDSLLVLEYNIPVKTPAVPPKCRYIDVWRSQLVMTGNRTSVNTVYYSDIGNEHFPADQSFITSSRLGGGNSGIKALDNALFIFKPESISAVDGDFGTDSFTVNNLSDSGIGCVAHATIQEIESKLYFLGNQGIFALSNKGVELISNSVRPRFDSTFVKKRAVAYHWIEKELYMLLLPQIKVGGAAKPYLDTTNSIVIVHDLFRQAFYEWKNINMLGGMAEMNGRVFLAGIDVEPVSLNSQAYTSEFLQSGTGDDYADHEAAVAFQYKSHWEALGEPSVYKKFLRMKIHSLDGSINDFEVDKFVLTITTEHDYDPISVSSFALDFSGGALGWGLSPWGTSPWGESRIEQLRSRLSAKKAKSLRTLFFNSVIHENVLISGYELEIATPYELALKE